MIRSSSHLGAIVTTLFLLGWFVTILFGFTRTADAQYSVPAYRGLSVRQNPAAAMPFNGSAAQVPVAAQVPGPAPRRMALQAAPPRGPNPRLQAAAPVNGLRTVTPVNRMQQQVVDEEEPLPLPQVAGGQLAGQPLDEPAGEVYYEEGQDVGVPVYGGGIADCDAYPYEGAGGPGYYEAATCDAYGPGYCGNEAVTPPLIYIDWRRFDAYFGTQAFTGPLNFAGTGANRATHDGSGSFGFHEAFNYGRNLPYAFSGELSEQLGLRATQSNFAGAEFTNEKRNQLFLTAGVFRRADFGLQGGVVFDYVHDDWYYRTDLTQLRGELSWRTKSALELGYRFALATNRSSSDAIIDDHVNPVANTIVRVRGLDQHRLFARYHATSTSVFEFSTGWTGDSDFLLGGQFEVPLDSQFGLATGFTMMAPDGPSAALDQQREQWNVFMSLVWRPVGNRLQRDYHLPLFPVADNGSFLVGTE